MMSPFDPIEITFQKIVDKLKKEADEKGISFEEYMQQLQKELDKPKE